MTTLTVRELVDRYRSMQVRRRGRPRRLAVVNRKGGSGKSTTAVQLAAALAGWGLRVRMLDGDPQLASISVWLPPASPGATLREVYFGEATMAEATAPTSVPGLYIVPSNTTLAEVEVKRPPGAETLLRDSADDLDDFDIEIMDGSAALGTVTVSLLAAAHELVIPIKASGLDFFGQAELKQAVELVKKRLNPSLTTLAALLVDTDGQTVLSRELEKQLAADYPEALIHQIPHSVRAAEAPFAHQPLTTFSPDNPVTLAYWGLAERMLARLDLEVMQ